jgi:hypothetical protein
MILKLYKSSRRRSRESMLRKTHASVKAAGDRYRAKAKESRKWYCAICDHACDKQAALTIHLQSTKHHQRASRHCAICKNTFCKKSKYEQHLKSMKHAKAVKLALSLDDSTDSASDSDTEMSMSTTVASKTKSFTQSTLEDFIASSTKTAIKPFQHRYDPEHSARLPAKLHGNLQDLHAELPLGLPADLLNRHPSHFGPFWSSILSDHVSTLWTICTGASLTRSAKVLFRSLWTTNITNIFHMSQVLSDYTSLT